MNKLLQKKIAEESNEQAKLCGDEFLTNISRMLDEINQNQEVQFE